MTPPTRRNYVRIGGPTTMNLSLVASLMDNYVRALAERVERENTLLRAELDHYKRKFELESAHCDALESRLDDMEADYRRLNDQFEDNIVRSQIMERQLLDCTCVEESPNQVARRLFEGFESPEESPERVEI